MFNHSMKFALAAAFAASLTLHVESVFAQSAQEIVAAADKVRNADQPFRSTLTLTE
jgi:hypothetical protein